MQRTHLNSSRLLLREPQGERLVDVPVRVALRADPSAEMQAQVIVPGRPGESGALELTYSDSLWRVQPQDGASARLNGQPLTAAHELTPGDVISFGAAQLIFAMDNGAMDNAQATLTAEHLADNATIAPLATVLLSHAESEAAEIEIRATKLAPPVVRLGAAAKQARRQPLRRPLRYALAAAAIVGLAVIGVMLTLQPVPLDLVPADATVSVRNGLGFHSGARLFVLPGTHALRAARSGYFPAQLQLQVPRSSAPATLRVHLTPRPGRIAIDTQGVSASVLIDGAEVARAPGEVEVAAGHRVFLLRAPHYLDYVAELDVAGAGQRQALVAKLQSSAGTLDVSVTPVGATIEIDGAPAGTAPASLALEAGVHEVTLAAPDRKSWTSRVAVKAGETTSLGPLTLGAPDALLALRSTPPGAEVSVTGAYRGRTPLEVSLPAGTAHQVLINLAGYRSESRSVRVQPGARSSIAVQLEPVLVAVAVRGEPADAELVVDGVLRGRTPQALSLTAAAHRLELRKDGYAPWALDITPVPGLERVVEYQLVTTADARRGVALAPTLTSQVGGLLALVPAGSFTMGSERREQGRRPNEGQRQVSFVRPFYIGTHEVTNGQYRRFRGEHISGFVDKQTLDIDNYPVSGISWSDAAQFCNWLSQQDGLPAAYARSGDRWELMQPVTTGYRLPTEAEWEYAARYVDGRAFRRYAWGEQLPVPPRAGNFAGAEALPGEQEGKTGTRLVEQVLPGYRDEHAVLAPVGVYGANALGIADLAGNVSEWVHDYYLSFVDTRPATDPLGPASGTAHMIRGSNWKTASIAELRLAWRDSAAQGAQTIGMRLARYAE